LSTYRASRDLSISPAPNSERVIRTISGDSAMTNPQFGLIDPDRRRNHEEPRGPVSGLWAVSGPPAGSIVTVGHTAADLSESVIMRPRVERPSAGWRGALFTASGGLINPGVSELDALRNELLRLVRRQLPGTHHIAVSSLKGGVGKTTVAAVLGLTLAEYRGDRVIAVDANPDAGTLADRLSGQTEVTVRDMINNAESIDSMTAVSRYRHTVNDLPQRRQFPGGTTAVDTRPDNGDGGAGAV
jgi:hypothetical protein